MKKTAGALIFALSTPLMALEIGVKVGSANVIWKDGDYTPLDLYASVYLESLSDMTPVFKAGPSVEILYGRKSLGIFDCWDYGPCRLDFTVTGFELNAKAAVTPVPMFDVFGGAGVSYGRFGLDASDFYTGNPVGTLGDEYGTGFQAFGGAQANFGIFGVGMEYKRKWVNTESVKGISSYTLNLSLKF